MLHLKDLQVSTWTCTGVFCNGVFCTGVFCTGMHDRKSVRLQFVQRRNRFDSCFKSVSTRTTFGNAWNGISISPYNSYEVIPFTNQTHPKLFENHQKPFPKRFVAVSFRFHVEACTIWYKKHFHFSQHSILARSDKSQKSFSNAHNLQLARKVSRGTSPLLWERIACSANNTFVSCFACCCIVESDHRSPQKWVKWLWGFGKKVLD